MKTKAQGFTLVEVMVALIIAALLLPALVMSFANQADGIGYLRDKSVAQWVAANELTRLRMDWQVTQLIFQGQREGQSSMAGRDWYWWVSSSETDVEDFYRIDVRVALTETENEQPLYTLTGFLSAPSEPLLSLPEDSPEEPGELSPDEQRDGG
ncbi:MAG: type II secretion system minor pseudopilin GspI [Halieaceae bacterium]|nr:type II secretion system minor pseudopilin GspI [Halieaceae bacterium]